MNFSYETKGFWLSVLKLFKGKAIRLFCGQRINNDQDAIKGQISFASKYGAAVMHIL